MTSFSKRPKRPLSAKKAQSKVMPPPRDAFCLPEQDKKTEHSNSTTAIKGSSSTQRRKIVNRSAQACFHCRRSHAGCSSERPCKRCISKNLTCTNAMELEGNHSTGVDPIITSTTKKKRRAFSLRKSDGGTDNKAAMKKMDTSQQHDKPPPKVVKTEPSVQDDDVSIPTDTPIDFDPSNTLKSTQTTESLPSRRSKFKIHFDALNVQLPSKSASPVFLPSPQLESAQERAFSSSSTSRDQLGELMSPSCLSEGDSESALERILGNASEGLSPASLPSLCNVTMGNQSIEEVMPNALATTALPMQMQQGPGHISEYHSSFPQPGMFDYSHPQQPEVSYSMCSELTHNGAMNPCSFQLQQQSDATRRMHMIQHVVKLNEDIISDKSNPFLSQYAHTNPVALMKMPPNSNEEIILACNDAFIDLIEQPKENVLLRPVPHYLPFVHPLSEFDSQQVFVASRRLLYKKIQYGSFKVRLGNYIVRESFVVDEDIRFCKYDPVEGAKWCNYLSLNGEHFEATVAPGDGISLNSGMQRNAVAHLYNKIMGVGEK